MKKINVAKLITGKRTLKNKTLVIDNGKILAIENFEGDSDLVAIPGFIDMHNHGGYGKDYMYANYDDFEDLQIKQAREGITSMLATIAVEDYDVIEKSIENLTKYIKEKNEKGAKLLGIHVEGPFLSPEHLGVMNPNDIKPVDIEVMKKWVELSEDKIEMVTIAPELEGAMDFIKYLDQAGIIASAGHSNATSEEMNEAIGLGLSQVTHMFNAMRSMHHRELGILGESLTNDYLYSEMAGCDEESIHPAAWKMAFKQKTPHKMILTTDALTLKGLPDGKYDYMGRVLDIRNGFAYTDYHGANRLPGKPMTFIGTVKNVMKNTGADLADIVMMSCVNPALRLGILDKKGYLEVGYHADINILDQNYDLVETYIAGEKVE